MPPPFDPSDPTVTNPARDPKQTAVPSGLSDTARTIAAGSAAPKFAPPTAPGEIGTLGPYRLVRELGKGGMGIVYLALDTRLDRKVALKVMLPEFVAHEGAQERFLREARAAAQISHDNVVTVYDAATHDGIPYIAMQFLQGYPLDDYLKKKGLPTIPQVLKLGREAALGLAAAHELGLVHRDIKPANLWLEAPKGRIKILDFGLARPVEAPGDAELTKSGAIVGTPAYMSPEQARGEKVDHRTDLWSLGGVLYRLCTGRTPFKGSGTMAILLALATEEPLPVQTLNPEVPPALARLIHQLLSKNPDHRPQSAAEVAELLRVIEERPWTDPGELPLGPARDLPRVVYVPMQVTMAPVSGAFDNLDVDEAEDAEDENDRDEPEPAKPSERATGGKAIWIGAVAAVVLAVAVVGVVIVALGKTNPASDDSTHSPDVKKAVPPVPPPIAKKDAKKDAPAEPDRRGAEYVLSIGGIIRINEGEPDLRNALDLPKQPFTLTKVWLRDNQQVTDAGLAACTGCRWLRHIDMVNTTVGDAGLAHFKESKGLYVLDLDRAPRIGDAGLVHFTGTTTITSLWLGSTGVTDVGLAAFAECKNLNHFDVKGTRVTDVGLVYFRGCKYLRELFLSNTAVTDVGLANFDDCKRLTLLDLVNTRVSDAGLLAFHECVTLQEVRLAGTRVTAAGVAELRKALPKCNVVWVPK